MSKIVAITGGTGSKSGSAFLKKVVSNEETIKKLFPNGIRLLVRDAKKLNDIDIKKFDIKVGDLSNCGYVNDALEDVDTVINIAGIGCSLNLVNSSIKNNVRRLILVHTTGIYSKYKESGENYRNIEKKIYNLCKKNKIKLTILRPTMIYGNITDNNVVKFIKMVDKLPIMPVVNNAKYRLQPVHYKDLAKAYYDVLINEEKTVNKDFILSGGEEIYLRDMFITIGELLGKKVKFINCPYFIAYSGAWSIYIITLKRIDYREKVQRLCEDRVYSFKEAKETFGYNPRSFKEGVINEIKEYSNKLK